MSEERVVPLVALAGQERALSALLALAGAEGPIPPLLFCGPEGVGKRSAALGLAAGLVCRSGTIDQACGRCPPCLRVLQSAGVTALRRRSTAQDRAQVYPDVGFVGIPEGKTRISVLQARDVELSLSVQPFELPRRIYIIEPADSLTPAAANSLLKVLEEPPPWGLLILVTAHPWALPVTVRSRMQAVRFGLLGRQTVEQLLVDQGYPASDAAERARYCRGRLSLALAADPAAEDKVRESWIRAIEKLSEGSSAAALATAVAEALGSDAAAAENACQALLELMRDGQAVASGAEPRLLDRSQAERLTGFVDAAGPALYDRLRVVELLRSEIRIFHRNPRLSVEGALLALAGRLDRAALGR